MAIKFEAGSYSYNGKAVRSIARYRESGKNWIIEVLLINIGVSYKTSQEAALLAKMDIDNGHKVAVSTGGRESIDHYLASIGYNILEEIKEEKI